MLQTYNFNILILTHELIQQILTNYLDDETHLSKGKAS